MSVYLKDIWMRLPELMAQITSTFGSILKIDSTKKVVKKLQGKAAGSASWATNIGNERGEVVMSVITDSESFSSLKRMADGLMTRYKTARQPAPKILYTDRDCCSLMHGVSKYKVQCMNTYNVQLIQCCVRVHVHMYVYLCQTHSIFYLIHTGAVF